MPEKLQDVGLDLASVSEIVKKLRRHENAWPFNQPVDPVALKVPDYLQIVKNPMDLGTIEDKINKGRFYLNTPSFNSFPCLYDRALQGFRRDFV